MMHHTSMGRVRELLVLSGWLHALLLLLPCAES
jgi:hypothetical protein